MILVFLANPKSKTYLRLGLLRLPYFWPVFGGFLSSSEFILDKSDNIYRPQQWGYGGRLNRLLLARTTFTDSTLQSGHTYFYVVTTVTTDGTESGKSDEPVF